MIKKWLKKKKEEKRFLLKWIKELKKIKKINDETIGKDNLIFKIYNFIDSGILIYTKEKNEKFIFLEIRETLKGTKHLSYESDFTLEEYDLLLTHFFKEYNNLINREEYIYNEKERVAKEKMKETINLLKKEL